MPGGDGGVAGVGVLPGERLGAGADLDDRAHAAEDAGVVQVAELLPTLRAIGLLGSCRGEPRFDGGRRGAPRVKACEATDESKTIPVPPVVTVLFTEERADWSGRSFRRRTDVPPVNVLAELRTSVPVPSLTMSKAPLMIDAESSVMDGLQNRQPLNVLVSGPETSIGRATPIDREVAASRCCLDGACRWSR